LANLFGSRTLRLWWDPQVPDAFVIINDHIISGRLMINNDYYIQHLLDMGILVEEPEFVYVSNTGLTGEVVCKISKVYTPQIPYVYNYNNRYVDIVNLKQYKGIYSYRKNEYFPIPNIEDCLTTSMLLFNDYSHTEQLIVGDFSDIYWKLDNNNHKYYGVTLKLYQVNMDTGKIEYRTSNNIRTIENIKTIYYNRSPLSIKATQTLLEIRVINSDLKINRNLVSLAYAIINHKKYDDIFKNNIYKILDKTSLFEEKINAYEINGPEIKNPHILTFKGDVPYKLYDYQSLDEYLNSLEYPYEVVKRKVYLIDKYSILTNLDGTFYVQRFLDKESYMRLVKAANLENDERFLSKYPCQSYEFEKCVASNVPFDDAVKDASSNAYRYALDKLKKDIKTYLQNKEIDEKIKKFIEEYPDVHITVEDSIEAGNCEFGTQQFAEKHLSKEILDRGYVTTKELWELRDRDWYNVRRVLVHVMEKHLSN